MAQLSRGDLTILLMDTIGHAQAMIGHNKDPVLGVFHDLAHRLEGTPRYLLDRNATLTAVELNLGRPKVMLEALKHLRIPYPRLWVEWDDDHRQELRERFQEKLSFPELRPMPRRVGFLLEAGEGGRSGSATWLWTSPAGVELDVPNVGPIEPYFDLDRRFPMSAERHQGMLRGNLAHLWLDNPVQLAALFDIFSTAEHRPSPWGEIYMQRLDPLHQQLAYADVVGEFLMIWSVMLLLTASRPVIDLIRVDLGRLNKQRVKKGSVPLLDHTNVTMRLQLPDPRYNPVIRGPLGYSRKSPRIHMVGRYLARRGTRHWIVEPYFRGKGDTVHRRVHVRG